MHRARSKPSRRTEPAGTSPAAPARRRTLRPTLALLAAALIGCGLPLAEARANDSLSVRLDWITEPMHMPFFLAVERGWFKAADLDVAIDDGNGSTTTVQLVGNGRYDIGLADLGPMAIGRGKGVPIVSIAGLVRKSGMGFIVPLALHVTSLDDLVGKEILYTAGSLEGPFVEPLFRQHGIGLDKINLLNIDAASKIPSYVAGRGDAVVSTVPSVLIFAEEKRPSEGLLFSDLGFRLPGFGLISQPETLRAKGPAIRRFVSIICGAWLYILKSPAHAEEAGKDTLAQRPASPLPLGVMLKQEDAYRGFFYTAATRDQPIGIQSIEDWTVAVKNMEDAKVIPPGTRPADYFTNDFIDLDTVKTIAASE